MSHRITRRALAARLAALGGSLALARLPAAAQPRLGQQALVGTWSGQEAGPLGTMALEVIFMPNGTYRRMHRLGDLLTYDTGTYQVVQNWIHFRLTSYGPHTYRGQRLTRPMTDTWVVGRMDGRTLQATVGGVSHVSVQRR